MLDAADTVFAHAVKIDSLLVVHLHHALRAFTIRHYFSPKIQLFGSSLDLLFFAAGYT
jgi:hypothetical protein